MDINITELKGKNGGQLKRPWFVLDSSTDFGLDLRKEIAWEIAGGYYPRRLVVNDWHTPGGSCSYTSFEEVSPGRLLYVFSTLKFRDAPGAELANCIRGVYIDVERVK